MILEFQILQDNAMVKMKIKVSVTVCYCLFPLGMSSWQQKTLSRHSDQAEYKGHNANFICNSFCSVRVLGLGKDWWLLWNS